MNKSIIISESVKAYFSSHASLAAIGRKVKKQKVFEPIEQKVKIAQKTVKYSPAEKLLDAFITLLAGAQGMVEVNKRLKADTGLAASVWTKRAVLNNRWCKIPWMPARQRTWCKCIRPWKTSFGAQSDLSA